MKKRREENENDLKRKWGEQKSKGKIRERLKKKGDERECVNKNAKEK